MRRRPPAAGLTIAISALALIAGGCRDGEAPPTNPSTATIETTPATTATTSTPPATTSVQPTSTATAATSPTTTAGAPPTTNPEDSADNDLPPEPSSPEEAFEQECEEHPERCG